MKIDIYACHYNCHVNSLTESNIDDVVISRSVYKITCIVDDTLKKLVLGIP